jgi:endonuclease I
MRRGLLGIVFVVGWLTCACLLQAAYEAPNPLYNPPTNYYNPALGTGLTLRSNLHTIISTGFVGRSYGDSRWNMATVDSDGVTKKTSIDQDPNNPNNIILIYNNASIPGTWDAGATWNREHEWPKHWLGVTSAQVSNTYIGPASDSFELRPSNPNVNSSRNDDGYGLYPYAGSYGANSGFWYPSTADAGEVARTMFYMATRYFNPSNPLRGTDIQNLELVNGAPTTFNMGDLNSFLHWNYEYGVDNFERRRNQYIYGSSGDLTDHALNPKYYQGNRNPYIDHPEYVWAVFGTDKDGSGNIINNSQLSLGTGVVGADGSSSAAVDLGRIMVNGTFGTSNVNFNKTGNDPTTFDLTTAGSAAIGGSGPNNLFAGAGQGIDFGTQSRTITVGLNASTSTGGLKNGVVTLHNTDLTTSGGGHGSADGNDTINVSGAVLNQRVVTPSASNVNFGSVVVGATVNNNFNLTTTGDDNSFTRVNVAGSSTADSNGMQITGSTALFNSAASTSSRSLGGTLSSVGNKTGSLSLAVSTAENGGAGLAGEGAYSAISVGYSATVLDHANASFSGTQDTDSITIDLGVFAKGTGMHQAAFSLFNLITTVGFTAGLDLNSILGNGDTSELTTTLASFQNLAAGSSSAYFADLNTDITGNFSASYSLGLSDNALLPGATAQAAPLTLTLTGIVKLTAGDFNFDQHVDSSDIASLLSALTDLSDYESQNNLTPQDMLDLGDLNSDGAFNNADLQAFLNLLLSGHGSTASVPEPASLGLLVLGSLCMLGVRARRRVA